MSYWVLAYYHLVPLASPEEEVAKHHAFFKGKDITCRIYISSEGINGQLSASTEAAKSYMEWLKEDSRFAGVEFKIHEHFEQVFPRVTVKVRSQLVALDQKVDLSNIGTHVSPQEWKEMLEKRDENTVVIDVRNDYEWKLGHFEGAEMPTVEQFRHFPAYAQSLKQTKDPKDTTVMMYCTGGIRCEFYSALLKEHGFDKVYQLQGGVIKYGLEEGHKHWKGKLFVFDDRLSVSLKQGEESEIISTCIHCQTPSDLYYNCANMDCNELFIACQACAEKLQGCCCSLCLEAPRVRAFEARERPKPYRRLNKGVE